MRCLEAGVPDPQGKSPQVQRSDAMHKAIHHGWTWKVVAAVAEDHIPDLVHFLQLAQNSTNSIAKPINELEVACQLAALHQAGTSLKDGVAKLQAGDVQARMSLPSICHYVQRYSGGPEFPLIKFLSNFSSQWGTALLLGEEFCHQLAHQDFMNPTNVFPYIRAACWATQLTTNKHADGVSKLLSKADLQRMASPGLAPEVTKAESILADCWKVVQASMQSKANAGNHSTHLHRCFGKLCVRAILYLTRKQKYSREKTNWSNLEDILQAFTQEVQGLPSQDQAADAATNSSSNQEVVADLSAASAATVAMMQNSHMQLHQLQPVLQASFLFSHLFIVFS